MHRASRAGLAPAEDPGRLKSKSRGGLGAALVVTTEEVARSNDGGVVGSGGEQKACRARGEVSWRLRLGEGWRGKGRLLKARAVCQRCGFFKAGRELASGRRCACMQRTRRRSRAPAGQIHSLDIKTLAARALSGHGWTWCRPRRGEV
jgi:hypothetical protein